MTTQIAATTPLESLPAIEREFAAGNYVASSRLLWDATKSTFLMLGRAHDLETGCVREIARTLDEKYPSDYRYTGLLISGWVARDHVKTEAFELYNLEISHRLLPEFIRWCYGEFGSDDDNPNPQPAARNDKVQPPPA